MTPEGGAIYNGFMLGTVKRPVGFDPLIAEAKRRTRRRRLVITLLVLSAAAAALTFVLRPSGTSTRPVRDIGQTAAGGSLFAVNGFSVAGTNGFDGDRGLQGGRGMQLGCLPGRHYTEAVTVNNKSGKTVTLTGVRVPDPAPRIVEPVAIQLRLAAPPSTGDRLRIVLHHWSSAPGHPVKIPPGRSAVVQSNFLMHQCHGLAHGRTVTVPGTLLLHYSISGKTGTQRVTQPGANFIVAQGPTIRSCTPMAGSIRMAASDISCAQARAAAPICHDHSGHWNSGRCFAAGRYWDCDFRTVTVQWCWEWNGGGEDARLYRVRWEPKSH